MRAKRPRETRDADLSKNILKIVHKFLLSFCFTHKCRHLFLEVANYVGMDFCCSGTFDEFIDLISDIYNKHQQMQSLKFHD